MTEEQFVAILKEFGAGKFRLSRFISKIGSPPYLSLEKIL
jgi:hypothetical protein